MPIYEYECPKCQVFMTKIASVEDVFHCPNCKRRMIRLISLSSFRLKGRFWEKPSVDRDEDEK